MAPLHFGILLTPCQTLDVVGPLDVLQSSSLATIKGVGAMLGPSLQKLLSQAPDFRFHYVGVDNSPVTLSGNTTIVPTTTCDTCPPLDYVLVGGTDFTKYSFPPRFSDFLRDHLARGKTLFTTCTGAWHVAETGVLDGKKATMNRLFLGLAKKDLPKVRWTGDEGQWVVDGQIWTSGGAVAGMDMMASWVIQEFGIDVAMFGFEALDFEPRDKNGDANVVVPKQRGPGKSEKATWV